MCIDFFINEKNLLDLEVIESILCSTIYLILHIKMDNNETIEININNSSIKLHSTNTIEELFQTLNIDENNKQFFVHKDEDEKIKITEYNKKDHFSGKFDQIKLQHPLFLKRNNTSTNVSILNFNQTDNVLILSPHPDDEVLGTGALLKFLFANDIKTAVFYQTTGKSAGDVKERQDEAIKGIEQLGGTKDNTIFGDMPFYNKNPREISQDDDEYLLKAINELNPNKVFVCGDVFDPNRTHFRCFNVLMNILESLDSNVNVFMYYSVWYWPKENEYDHYLPYDYSSYKAKLMAMMEHRSQIDTNYMGDDPRPFYQRALTRDACFGRDLGEKYCEVFYKLK